MYNPYFYPPSLPPISYAGGGNVARQQEHGLAAAAEQLRRRGREGDTILAHISPEEAGILKLLGGSGTINPHTGLPEYKKFWKNLTLKNVLPSAAATVAFVASGGNPAAAAAAAASVKAAQGAPIEDVAKTAILTYGGASIGGAGAEGGGGGTLSGGIDLGGAGYDTGAFGDFGAGSSAGSAAGSAAGSLDVAPLPGSAAGEVGIKSIPAGASTTAGTGAAGSAATTAADWASAVDSIEAAAGTGTAGAGTGAATGSAADVINKALAEEAAPKTLGDYLSTMGTKALNYATEHPLQTALAATTGYGAITAAQETKAQREAAQAELARQEAKRQQDIKLAESTMEKYPSRYRRLTAADVRRYGIGMPRGYVAPASVVNPTLSPVLQAASGGSIRSYDDETGSDDEVQLYGGGLGTLQRGLRFARGGISSLPPRYLSGGGDGMSDSIPARIGGKQEARLADGEFVIPADVVSHIGNGSSNAGAKKLYEMMDRIRKARTGKTKQAPAIKTSRLMPA